MESTSADWSASLTGLVVLIVGIFPVLIWARYRWVKLKAELFPGGTENESSMQTTPGCALAARAACALRLLSRARSLLDKEDSLEAKVAADALRKLESSSTETAPAIDKLITRALETAEVGSLLLGAGGLYVYVVVVPNRHEHAHLLRRYSSFSAGWRYHIEVVRASLISSGQFSGLAAILLFLSPEGKENILQLSCVDTDSMLIPPTLVEGDDFGAIGVGTHSASVEFTLSA